MLDKIFDLFDHVRKNKTLDQQIVNSYTKMIKMYYKCMRMGEFNKAVQILTTMKAALEVQILATTGLVKMNENVAKMENVVNNTAKIHEDMDKNNSNDNNSDDKEVQLK